MAAGQLVVPRRRGVVGFDNPRRDFDPYYRNGKNGYHGSSMAPPHFEDRRNGFNCRMEERGESREPSPNLEDGEIAVCDDEKGPELQPKKRKFSPIVWDVKEKKVRVSSKNRVYPTSTTQSSPPSHPQTIAVLNENSAQALVVDTGLETPVTMLSPLSPQDDQEHGQVEEAQEEEAQEEEAAEVRNISLSRWASESDSPRDVAVFHDDVSVGSVGRIKSTSGSDERDHSGGSTCKDHSQNEAEKDLLDINLQGENTGVEHFDSGDDTPQLLSDDDMNGGTEGNLNMLHGCREVDEYERLNEINEGTYGKVYRARDKKTEEIVALKKVKMDAGGSKNLEEYGFPITSLREINIMLSMNHPSIVNVKGVVTGPRDSVFMVMECMEHDLKDLMQAMKQPFSTSEVKCLMLQLLEGVKFLHHNWVLHRDLKTSNLLFNNKGDLKICDFGMSRRYSSPLKTYTSLVVTLWYRAPELLLGAKRYSTAIDMWSVGCIMAELLTKEPLFKGKRELDQLDKIFRTLGTPNETVWPGFSRFPGAKANFVKQPYNRLREKFPATYFTVSSVLSDSGLDLLSKLLTYHPEKRITADEALNHAWFREVPLPKSKEFMPTFPTRCTKKR